MKIQRNYPETKPKNDMAKSCQRMQKNWWIKSFDSKINQNKGKALIRINLTF
jgi:hypothetical protein